MSKTQAVRNYIEAHTSGNLLVIGRLPRRKLSAHSRAVAVNRLSGAVGSARTYAGGDGRVGVAVAPDGRVAGVQGRHVIMTRLPLPQ